MKAGSIIDKIISNGNISNRDIADLLIDKIDSIDLDQYELLKKLLSEDTQINDSIYSKMFVKADDTVKYQMWKEELTKDVPINLLLDDVKDEDEEVLSVLSECYSFECVSVDACFSKIQDTIIDYINHAKKTLRIAMAWFTNPVIFKALLEICKTKDTKDIDVTLIINNDRINNRPDGLPFNELIDNGASLYVAEIPNLIHHKFCIIDEKIVIDGSYNWTINAELNNDENAVIIKNSNAVKDFVNAFAILLKKYTKVDEMPERPAERPEMDCTSYKNVNANEYIQLANKARSKREKRKFLKHIYREVEEDLAEAVIPKKEFENVKNEVVEEREHDDRLFINDLQLKQKQLQDDKDKAERNIAKRQKELQNKEEKLNQINERQKRKICKIKQQSVSEKQKEEKIKKVENTYRAEKQSLSREIKNYKREINSTTEQINKINVHSELIDNLKDNKLLGNSGLCRINLQWRTYDDLDLYLVLPDKQEVCYDKMEVCYCESKCTLDYDANAACQEVIDNPQENIVINNCLADGKYLIKVNLYQKYDKNENSGIPFLISIFNGDSKPNIDSFIFDLNEKDTMDIAELTIKNGKLVTPIKFLK